MAINLLQQLKQQMAEAQARAKATTTPVIATKTVTTTAVPASVPVSHTSLSNANTIANRYRSQGYTAKVVSEGGGYYKVELTKGAGGVIPITAPKVTIPTVTTPTITAPKVTAPKVTTPTTIAPATKTMPSIAQTLSRIIPTTPVTKTAPETTKILPKELIIYKKSEAVKGTTSIKIPEGNEIEKPLAKPLTTKTVAETVKTPVVMAEKAPTIKPLGKLVEPTTEPIAPTKVEIPSIIKAKMEALKEKFAERREEVEVIKEKVKIAMGTASKETLTETGTPVYSEEEIKISRTNPSLAQSLFTSRTGIRITGTISTVVSDEEKKIAEQIKLAPKVIASQSAKRTWAVQQLVDKGELPYGFDGYTPGGAKEEATAYVKQYGWRPDKGWSYNSAINEIDNQITQIQRNITSIEDNIKTARDNIPKLIENRDVVVASEHGTLWKAPDVPQETLDKLGIERKDQYSRVELTKILNYGIQANEDAIKQQDNITKLNQSINQLKTQKQTITDYQQKGYDIEQTGEGYQFKYPTAYEAHVGIFGKSRTDAMLSSASFVESPLGLGTFFSAIQSAVTGDESVRQNKLEDLAKYSFGLQEALREGPGSYVGKVITSGAIVQGVVIPTITLGASYGLSAVSAGASGLVPTGGVITKTLMKVGASGAGKAVVTTGKVVGMAVGGVGTVSTGIALGSTLAQEPTNIGELIGETAFSFGMAYGGFKTGAGMAKEKITTIPVKTEVTKLPEMKTIEIKGGTLERIQEIPSKIKVNVSDISTGKVKEVTIGRVPKPTDVRGEMDIIQTKVAGTTENKVTVQGIGTQKITGRPDVKVTIKGEGLQVPGEDVSLSQGTGTMAWKETIKGVTRSYVKEFQWSGQGKYIQEIGPTKIYETTGKSQLVGITGQGPGETVVPMYRPTISSGTARVTDVGKMQFSTEPIPKGFENIFAQKLSTEPGVIRTWEAKGVKEAWIEKPGAKLPKVVKPEMLPQVEQYTYTGKFFEGGGGKGWGKSFQSGRIFTFEAEQPLMKITEVPTTAEPIVSVTRQPIVHTPWKFPKAEAPIAGGPSAEPTTAGLLYEAKPGPSVPSTPLTLGGLLESISTKVVEVVGPIKETVVAEKPVVAKPVAKPVAPTIKGFEGPVETITIPTAKAVTISTIETIPTVEIPLVEAIPGFAVPKPRPIRARRGEMAIESPFRGGSIDELMAGRAGIVPSRFDVEEVRPEKPAEVRPVVTPTTSVKPIFASFVGPTVVTPVATVTAPAIPTITKPGRIEVTAPKKEEEVTPIVSPVAGVELGLGAGLGKIQVGELGWGRVQPVAPVGITVPIQKPEAIPKEELITFQEPAFMQRERMATIQEQRQMLQQEQIQETEQRTALMPVLATPTVVTPFKFTPYVPFLPTPPPVYQETKRQAPKKRVAKPPTQRLEIMEKEFLADIASVTKSQAVYGKATHPRLTKEQWAKAEATGYVVVPTVEIEEAEKGKIAEPKSVGESLGIGKGELLKGIDIGLEKGKRKKIFDLGIGGL